MQLSSQQLTGRIDSHVEYRGEELALQAASWEAFGLLQQAAAVAGHDLRIASGFRSFERQLIIWNGKARGERPVHDDAGDSIDLNHLDNASRMHAILRFSALPGTSRHHWGTDLDVFDAAAVAEDYQVQLTPAEVAADGVFASLHTWLDQRIRAGQAFGFERPYDADRGGVAPERWHLSYTPLARGYESELTVDMLGAALRNSGIELLQTVLEQLPEIHRRYACPPPGEGS